MAAVEDVEFVLHEAALGSVPRSISDPITTNEVNISRFLNILIAARDTKVKRFIYAASSSTNDFGSIAQDRRSDWSTIITLSCHKICKRIVCRSLFPNIWN